MTSIAARPSVATGPDDRARESKGFRPASRRRARIAGGAALAAVAIGGNVLVYASLDDRTEVLQVVTDIAAGEVVTADDLRIVEVDVDPTVPVVAAEDIGLVVDHHARVHLSSGTLLSPLVVQPAPLVAAGTAVVAVEIRPTQVPSGVRERSLLELVVLSAGDPAGDELRTRARAVTRPADVEGVSGLVSMSVEVAVDDAARVAAADEIRIVLLEPGIDPAYDEAAD